MEIKNKRKGRQKKEDPKVEEKKEKADFVLKKQIKS